MQGVRQSASHHLSWPVQRNFLGSLSRKCPSPETSGRTWHQNFRQSSLPFFNPTSTLASKLPTQEIWFLARLSIFLGWCQGTFAEFIFFFRVLGNRWFCAVGWLWDAGLSVARARHHVFELESLKPGLCVLYDLIDSVHDFKALGKLKIVYKIFSNFYFLRDETHK